MPLNITVEKEQTKKYLDNLSNIDENSNNQIYFWVAVLKDDTEIVQFDENSNEITFSVVKEELKKDNVKYLKWVSKKSTFDTYCMEINSEDELIKGTGIYRRGKVTRFPSGKELKTWSYCMGKIVNGEKELFIINNKGTGKYTDNENLEVGS